MGRLSGYGMSTIQTSERDRALGRWREKRAAELELTVTEIFLPDKGMKAIPIWKDKLDQFFNDQRKGESNSQTIARLKSEGRWTEFSKDAMPWLSEDEWLRRKLNGDFVFTEDADDPVTCGFDIIGSVVCLTDYLPTNRRSPPNDVIAHLAKRLGADFDAMRVIYPTRKFGWNGLAKQGDRFIGFVDLGADRDIAVILADTGKDHSGRDWPE